MARIRVLNKALQQYGTIEESDFNSQLFEKAEKPGLLKQAVTSPLLPWGTATLGGLAGSVTPFTPVGGAAIGYGAGSALQNMLKDLLGYQTKTPLQQVGGAVTGATAAGLGAGTLATLPYLMFPSLAARKVETFAKQAGEIPPQGQALEQKFGTTQAPKPELYKGLAPASGEQNLIDILRHEIATQGRIQGEGGAIRGPTYEDILNWRKGAYGLGKWSQQVPSEVSRLYRNIGGAYSGVLHTGIPETRLYDYLYGLGQATRGAAGYAGKTAARGIEFGAGAGLLGLLTKALGIW